MTEKLRVLIVEDDAMIADLLAEIVVNLGHEVCAMATMQADAVVAAKESHPDLMIVDAGLADGSGVDAVATILKGGFIPHLFVTGSAMQVEEQRPDAIILRKPFFVPELVAAITNAVAMRVIP